MRRPAPKPPQMAAHSQDEAKVAERSVKEPLYPLTLLHTADVSLCLPGGVDVCVTLSLHQIQLKLLRPFGTSHSVTTHRTNAVVCVQVSCLKCTSEEMHPRKAYEGALSTIAHVRAHVSSTLTAVVCSAHAAQVGARQGSHRRNLGCTTQTLVTVLPCSRVGSTV